jgi:hypothetical protein
MWFKKFSFFTKKNQFYNFKGGGAVPLGGAGGGRRGEARGEE